MSTSDTADPTGPADPQRFWRPSGADPHCPRCGGTGLVRRRVPVDHEDFGRALPCVCAERAAADQLAEQLQRLSNLGPLVGARLSDAELAELASARAACDFADEATEETWLVVSGAAGSGRTRLAAELANRRLQRGRRALYFVAADLLDLLRAAYQRDAQMPYPVLFQHAREAEFLIIDDLDLANPTDWAREKLYQLLNHRWSSRRRTVLIVGAGSADKLNLARWLKPHPGVLSCAVERGRSASLYHPIGGPPEQILRNMTFETFRVRNGEDLRDDSCNLHSVKQNVLVWASDPRGWLTLHGGTGTGKTHLAAAVANAALERGQEVWFAVVPDLLDQLRLGYREDAPHTYDGLSAALRDAPLLVLDDFGTHSPTPWADEKLYQLCAGRHAAMLPTMFTTNLDLNKREELINAGALDPRIASRLTDERNHRYFELKAPDYRTGVSHRRSGKGRTGNRGSRRTSGAF